MGDTGLELASGAQVRSDSRILLAYGALRSAQVRSNCYQNCYQARAIRGAGDDRPHAYCSSDARAPLVLTSLDRAELIGWSGRTKLSAGTSAVSFGYDHHRPREYGRAEVQVVPSFSVVASRWAVANAPGNNSRRSASLSYLCVSSTQGYRPKSSNIA
jgi:hypothetical protein